MAKKKVTKKVSKKAPTKKTLTKSKVLVSKKSKSQLNKEAALQNAQAGQDVAAEDTELGEAIKHANQDQV